MLILSLSTQLKGLHNTLTSNIENTLDLIHSEIAYVGQKRMNHGAKGIRQWQMNYYTFPMMIHKITPSELIVFEAILEYLLYTEKRQGELICIENRKKNDTIITCLFLFSRKDVLLCTLSVCLSNFPSKRTKTSLFYVVSY